MIILASASPRRHHLLAAAGIPHIVQPADTQELRLPDEDPGTFVKRLALEKGQSLLARFGKKAGDSPAIQPIPARKSHSPSGGTVPPTSPARGTASERDCPRNFASEDIILSADTIVCVDTEVFGKPADIPDARRMLRSLSGRSHFVHTGICLHSASRTILDISTTEVFFIPLTAGMIDEYIQTGEPNDKAGAYSIQGGASRFVSKVHGCYHNVVGLPVSLVYRHLTDLGWTPTASRLNSP